MGLNLSFIQTPQYLEIAQCALARKTWAQLQVWTIQGEVLPPEALQHIVGTTYVSNGGIWSCTTLNYRSLPASVREEILKQFPLATDDEEDETSGYCRLESRYETSIMDNDFCNGCPLCPNDNFTHCYPRMGSYCYVASLADFVDNTPEAFELRDNLFVRATEPGGYRINTPEIMSQASREDFYRQHLCAIIDARGVLFDVKIDGARIYLADGTHGGFYAAEEERNNFGMNQIASSRNGVWGVHRGRGIYFAPRQIPNNGNYFREVRRDKAGEDFCSMVAMDDNTQRSVSDCALLRSWNDNDPEMSALVWDTAPALEQFDRLLDTAETMLQLALQHHLIVEEC